MRLPKSINVGGIERPKFRLKMLPSQSKVKESMEFKLLQHFLNAGNEVVDEYLSQLYGKLDSILNGLMPYSIRSTLYQTCDFLSMYDESDWDDICVGWRPFITCIISSGLSKKESRCLWLKEFLNICETDEEREFFLSYLTEAFLANAGGEFPMAIPQVWLGRDIRVDFVIFIPKNDECEGIAVEIGTVSRDKPTTIKSLGFEFYQVDKPKLKEDAINIVSEVYNRLKNLENSKYGISLTFHYP